MGCKQYWGRLRIIKGNMNGAMLWGMIEENFNLTGHENESGEKTSTRQEFQT